MQSDINYDNITSFGSSENLKIVSKSMLKPKKILYEKILLPLFRKNSKKVNLSLV